MPDPRRRDPLPYVLIVDTCAVLSGAKALAAIAEWAADSSEQVLFCFGAALRDPDRPCRAPSEANVRRVLQRIDGEVLDAASGG
ncbi:transposase family protein [Streptomyces sp. NBC_01594]